MKGVNKKYSKLAIAGFILAIFTALQIPDFFNSYFGLFKRFYDLGSLPLVYFSWALPIIFALLTLTFGILGKIAVNKKKLKGNGLAIATIIIASVMLCWKIFNILLIIFIYS